MSVGVVFCTIDKLSTFFRYVNNDGLEFSVAALAQKIVTSLVDVCPVLCGNEVEVTRYNTEVL
jgi:hypothetical protein